MKSPQSGKTNQRQNHLPENPTPSSSSLAEPIHLTEEAVKRIQRWLQQSHDESVHVEIKDDLLYLRGITFGDLIHRVQTFEMLGAADPELQKYLYGQPLFSFRDGVPYREMTEDTWKKNGLLTTSMMRELGPRDLNEGMLALQMATVHNLCMKALKLADLDEQSLDWQKHYFNVGAKLGRLFLRQVEMFRKCQGQGQQQVIVKYVQVNEGGQAIVGHIEAGRQRDPEGRA